MDAWLATFRRFWSAYVDALERHLNGMNQARKRRLGEDDATQIASVSRSRNYDRT
jgi:hypothetical protein